MPSEFSGPVPVDAGGKSSCKKCTKLISLLCSFFFFGMFLCLFVPFLVLASIVGLTNNSEGTGFGRFEVGNSDVVRVTDLNFTEYDYLTFSHLSGGPATVLFYQNSCSKTKHRIQTVSMELNVTTNTTYRIDELYFTNGSEVSYFFQTSEASNESLPVATLYFYWQKYSSYATFLLSGEGTNFYSSKTLFSSSNWTWTLPDGRLDSDIYFFVGMKGLSSTLLHYTETKDVREYDVSHVSPTAVCTISPPESLFCDVVLDRTTGVENDICLFASLQNPNDTFVSMRYGTPVSHILITAFYVILVIFVACLIFFTIFFVIFSLC